MPKAAPTQRARRADYWTTRRRILDAARQLTAERGPESLTVSEVAHQAGLNRTTAYQHFRTRDELVAAVMDELANDLADMFDRPGPLEERLEFMAFYLADHPEIARLALHHLLAENPLPRIGLDRFVAEVRKLTDTDGARPDVDAEMLAPILGAVGLLWPLFARIEFDGPEASAAATRRLTRELKRLLLHGVLRPEAFPGLEASLEPVEPERHGPQGDDR